MPHMTEVKSSNISHVGYDSEVHALHVRFKHSGTYIYDNVPNDIHAELIRRHETGESLGGYFHTAVKSIFHGRKLESA